MKEVITMMNPLPIFDGHNDVLLQLHLSGSKDNGAFFAGGGQGHVDLPRARVGGFGGGFFAVFVPPDPPLLKSDVTITETGREMRMPPPLNGTYAQRVAMAMVARLFRLEAESEGQVKVVHIADELMGCLETGVLAAVLHFEGAEPIDPELDALEVFYKAGLRSLGIVWSRPNAFGYGVPLKFPHSPDTGPGLTEHGKELVHACNHLGIMLDLSHLNEQGFWDVVRLSNAPLVATHSNAHAICPSARNLTDRQLDAIKDSGGVVGLNFGVIDLREDGRWDVDTPLSTMVRQIDYLVKRVGLEHVGFGSDFDGTMIPQAIGDVAGLPKLMAVLREHGYDEATLGQLAYENWLRVLQRTWQ